MVELEKRVGLVKCLADCEYEFIKSYRCVVHIEKMFFQLNLRKKVAESKIGFFFNEKKCVFAEF